MYEYFYTEQANQFSFYRIPKVLFTDEIFNNISAEAKILYGILLDRMSLSQKNGWTDELGRVYIIYTIEEIMDSLGCQNQKANKLMHELEKKCGLIERKRQGLGKPNVILPIAGVILAIVMTLELIQLITDRNNMHDVDTWMFFKWIFKTACAVLIVSHTWDIVMGVFDVAQNVINRASGIVLSNTNIDIASHFADLETRLNAMGVGELLGLWLQSFIVGISMWALSICIFIIAYAHLNNDLIFNNLSSGSYTMKVVATDTSGKTKEWSTSFTVNGASSTVKTGVINIPASWDNLSIRTGPGTNYQIIGSMNQGDRCTVYTDKTSNGWYYVEYNGITGYASGRQIDLQ